MADTNTSPKPVDELTYEEALNELEAIIKGLETAATSVDVLSTQVTRGTQLVEFCKSKLAAVSTEVDKTVADLQDP